jgi:hypothetical protein
MSGYGDMPFGLSELKLIGVTNAGTVTLPVGQKLKFKERVASAELRGDDVLKAVASMPEGAEWEIEAGGLSLEAYALMTGRTVTASGTTPAGTVSFKAGTGFRSFPYFKIYGKALGVGSDDVHCKLFKCKLTDGIEGSFANGEFFTTGIKGVAVDDGSNGAFEFVQNETATALPTS